MRLKSKTPEFSSFIHSLKLTVHRNRSKTSEWLRLCLFLVLLTQSEVLGSSTAEERLSRFSIIPTASPEEKFSLQPRNASVPEGRAIVMKCKTRELPVQHCTWFYTKLENNFYDTEITPKVVKEFSPTTPGDCSIKIKAVKKIQEGQWLCQTRKFMGRTSYNTRPAYIRVITESEEREYHQGGGNQPPAPTAIPALRPPVMGPSNEEEEPNFDYRPDDHIQNTKTGETAILNCKVDKPVKSCGWVMPNNALLEWNEDSSVERRVTINTPIVNSNPSENSSKAEEVYEFIGDRLTGNCSLKVNNIKHHDEGNWRCIVKVQRSVGLPLPRALAASAPPNELEVKGHLIHLHLLDLPHHIPIIPGVTHQSASDTNYTLIALCLVGTILIIVVVIIIYCCYKRVWSKQEETKVTSQDELQRKNDPEYTQQWFRGRNLKIVDPNYTDDFKLRNQGAHNSMHNIEVSKMGTNQVIKYSDLDHYNQYLAMNQDFPGSVRSSTSSNTTLSTVIPDPLGRDRSISFGARSGPNSVNMSPNAAQHCLNNSGNQQIPFYEINRSLQRPVSLYSTGHVYEEIPDKSAQVMQIPPNHIINKQGMIIPAPPQGSLPTTPVYTNVIEDNDGYLIPSKNAKIVNTNTPSDADVPAQYLAMKNSNEVALPENSYQHPQNNQIVSLNNLSPEVEVTPLSHSDNHRRRSKESNQSQEENNIVNVTPGVDGNLDKPNNKNSTSLNNKHSPEVKPNPINLRQNPNRQRMPLPTQKTNPSVLQIHNSNQNNNVNTVISNLSSLHQRTTSLPDTNKSPIINANHSKSPSLVPSAENYDVPTNNIQVPRKLDAVPKSVNGSEISLDDIDGTIV